MQNAIVALVVYALFISELLILKGKNNYYYSQTISV